MTNDGVDFRLNGERVAMPAGSSWDLRLSDPHSVANRSSNDRVHLVIDAVVNDWVADGLAPAIPSPQMGKGHRTGLSATSDGLLGSFLLKPPDSKALRLRGF